MSILLCALWVGAAQAGMPSFSLTELATERLHALSFFGGVLLLAALGLQQIWNRATPWPRLNYRRALGLTVLWGLLFHLVLTMISGARELMTPGAWHKDGATYSLDDPAQKQAAADHAREAQIQALRTALWQYAAQHDGTFPPDEFDPAIDRARWRIGHESGLDFVYRPLLMADAGHEPVAWEPGVVGPKRWVLYSDGTLIEMDAAQLPGRAP